MGLPWRGRHRRSTGSSAVLGICLHRQGVTAVLWADSRIQASFQSGESATALDSLSHWLRQQPAGLPAVITLDTSSYSLQIAEAPPVEDDELADALRFRLRDLLPGHAAERSVVQAFRLPADAYRGRLDMAFVAVAEREDIRQLVSWCHRQTFRLRQITVPELALLEVVAAQEPETAVALLRLDESDGVIFLYAHGALYLNRRISTGLQALGVTSRGADALSLSNDAPLEALALDIQRSLDYFDSQQGMGLIGQVWVLPPEQDGLDDLLPALERNLNVPLRWLRGTDWAPVDAPQMVLSAPLLTAIGGALSYDPEY